MSEDGRRGPPGDEDAELALLLERAGPRPEPGDERMARWQHHFAAELTVERRRRHRRAVVWLGGACAAVIAAAVALNWSGAPAEPPPAAADVVTAFGGNVVVADGEIVRSLEAGDAVGAGERVHNGGRSGLGLRYRGVDVRLGADTTAVIHRERLELVAGDVYLDTGPDTRPRPGPPAGALIVETPAGTFSHLGTQFMVRVSGSEVLGAVREGAIRLRGGGRDVRIAAGPDTARAVLVSASGDVTRMDVDGRGALWSWALDVAPGMALNGASADAVLRWAAREQGLRLVYTSEAAARHARSAILTAPSEPMPPDRAVDFVDAATAGLRLDRSAARELRVGRAPTGSKGDEDAR